MIITTGLSMVQLRDAPLGCYFSCWGQHNTTAFFSSTDVGSNPFMNMVMIFLSFWSDPF